MTPHPDSGRITRAMQHCLAFAGPWIGDLYRFAAPRWATQRHLLTGVGAFHAGGRWHPVGAFAAVYLSCSPETALAESLSTQRRFGLPVRDAMPKTLNAVVANFHSVLDLTIGKVRQRLGLSFQRMLQERWWDLQAADQEAVTQATGRIAHSFGLEGMFVPSAAHDGGVGCVYFPDRLHARTILEIVNPDQLPKRVR